MISMVTNLWLSFLAGLLAPLGAVCILPLYPGFLVYLASKASPNASRKESKGSQKTIALFGIVVLLGIVCSMFIIGLLFTLLREPLSRVIGILSPVAFGILTILSILLIFGVDFTWFAPKTAAPLFRNPFVSSFVFGFFFGTIVIPCNPAPLIVLFALSTSTISFAANFFNFLSFGLGMGLPLLLLSFISAAKSTRVLGFLSAHQRALNIIAGIVMLVISLYYLFVVFRIAG